MGVYVDKIVLTSLLAGALYLFFMGAFNSIPLAASAAFIALALIKQLSGALPLGRIHQKRRSRSAAKAIIEELAFLSDAEARSIIAAALENAYPGEVKDDELIIVNRHPTGRGVCADEILPIYKENKCRERLIIASPAKADESAHSLAASMRKPMVRLIDEPMLAAIIARQGGRPCAEAPKRRRTARFSAVIKAAGRAHAGRCLLSGGTLILVYLFTGRTAYLITSLTLFLIAGLSVRNRPCPDVLFDKEGSDT